MSYRDLVIGSHVVGAIISFGSGLVHLSLSSFDTGILWMVISGIWLVVLGLRLTYEKRLAPEKKP